jgi:hypothetical protein
VTTEPVEPGRADADAEASALYFDYASAASPIQQKLITPIELWRFQRRCIRAEKAV